MSFSANPSPRNAPATPPLPADRRDSVFTVVRLTQSYVSGSSLSGSLTFENTSLADMGITPGIGIMTATFGSGDTLTVNAVPEPSSLALAGLGIVVAGWGLARRGLRQA